ncbi:response regulator transcription factor [Kineosporia sp. J2-2]|uniref:Response regulator transcription factor n=2 Tax=Kineosporia corallincola TaxID=2835133 RepID=A0ABS5TGN8_9ACTN|nr:response regulator transcription factor [Kineosporia corallincola]
MRTQLEAEASVESVTSTDSGIAAMIEVTSRSVDVMVLGLNLRGLSSSEVLRRVMAEKATRECRVIVVLTREEAAATEDVLRLGADGVIVDQFTAEDLCYAVRGVVAGHMVLMGGAADRLVGWFRSVAESSPPEPAETDTAALHALTAREREILELVAHGNSTEEVAGLLAIGVTTVRTHLHRLRYKLGVRDRAGLVSYAFRTGLMVTAA